MDKEKFEVILLKIKEVIYDIGRIFVLGCCAYYWWFSDKFSVSCGVTEDSWLRNISIVKTLCDKMDWMGCWSLGIPATIVLMSYANCGKKVNMFLGTVTAFFIARTTVWNAIYFRNEFGSYFDYGPWRIIDKNVWKIKKELADEMVKSCFRTQRPLPFKEGYKKEYEDFSHNYLMNNLTEIDELIKSTPTYKIKELALNLVNKVSTLYKKEHEERDKSETLADIVKSEISKIPENIEKIPKNIPEIPTTVNYIIKNSDAVASAVQSTGTSWIFPIMIGAVVSVGFLFAVNYLGVALSKIKLSLQAQDEVNKGMVEQLLSLIRNSEKTDEKDIENQKLSISNLEEIIDYLKSQKTINEAVQIQIMELDKKDFSKEEKARILEMLNNAEQEQEQLTVEKISDIIAGIVNERNDIVDRGITHLKDKYETLEQKFSVIQHNILAEAEAEAEATGTVKTALISERTGVIDQALKRVEGVQQKTIELEKQVDTFLKNSENRVTAVLDKVKEQEQIVEKINVTKHRIVQEVTNVALNNIEVYANKELKEKAVSIGENHMNEIIQNNKVVSDKFMGEVEQATIAMQECKNKFETNIALADKVSEIQTVVETGFMFMTELIQTVAITNPELPVSALALAIIGQSQNYLETYKNLDKARFIEGITKVKEELLVLAAAPVPGPGIQNAGLDVQNLEISATATLAQIENLRSGFTAEIQKKEKEFDRLQKTLAARESTNNLLDKKLFELEGTASRLENIIRILTNDIELLNKKREILESEQAKAYEQYQKRTKKLGF